MITLKLEIDELTFIANVLAQLPHGQVDRLMTKIRAQANPQVEAIMQVAEAADAAKAEAPIPVS